MEFDEECLEILNERDGWAEPTVLVREYSVRIDALPHIPLGIRIYRDADRDRDPYRFDLSHYAATPTQAGPYIPSGPWRPSEATALRAALKAVTDYISDAVAAGHPPKDTWLKPSSTWT